MPSLRPGTVDDAPRIAEIYNQSIAAQDSTMELRAKETTDVRQSITSLEAREVLLVVVDNGQVQGWGILKKYSSREGYRFTGETSVYVDRRHVGKRRGYGSMVQKALINQARTHDYHHLVAKVWADNEVSRALHTKFGYTLVGVQKEIGYVSGKWQDVAIMQLLLGDGTNGKG